MSSHVLLADKKAPALGGPTLQHTSQVNIDRKQRGMPGFLISPPPPHKCDIAFIWLIDMIAGDIIALKPKKLTITYVMDDVADDLTLHGPTGA